MESKLNQSVIQTKSNRASFLFVTATIMCYETFGGMEDIQFQFAEDACTMTWQERGDTNTISIGLDGKDRLSDLKLGQFEMTVSSCAAWQEDGSLLIYARPLQGVSTRILRFSFSGDAVRMAPDAMRSIQDILAVVHEKPEVVVLNPFLGALLRPLVKLVASLRLGEKLFDPVVKGKLIARP